MGRCLAAAEGAGFDLFITADRELSYQQNLEGRKIAVLVLSTINWRVIQSRVAKITMAIDATSPGSLTFVEVGHGRG
jgi:hypothetical protein